MSTSDRAFNQVKAILQKLDRSIDEARQKRTQPPAASPDAPDAPKAPPPGSSGYGRATPIPPGRSTSSLQRWTR